MKGLAGAPASGRCGSILLGFLRLTPPVLSLEMRDLAASGAFKQNGAGWKNESNQERIEMKTSAKKNVSTAKRRLPVGARFLLAAIACIALSIIGSADAEEVGTSQSDMAAFVGKVVIHNHTGVTIQYMFKWGERGQEERCTLASGKKYEHRHALDDHNKAPAPFLRYDWVAGDNKSTVRTVALDFGKAGYSGYGAGGYVDEAVHYHFVFSPDGKVLRFVKGAK